MKELIRNFFDNVSNWRTTIIGLCLGVGAVLLGLHALTPGVAAVLTGIGAIAFILSKDVK